MDVVVQNIRRIMHEKGLKQRFVAEKSEFTEQEFSNLLNGRKRMDVSYINRICFALNANVYLQSGSGTLRDAISMAVQDMQTRGIQAVMYKGGRRVPASSYARMALRTANERAQLMGEGKARDKFGVHTIIAPASGIACPKCAEWLGRVMVDDVYCSGTAAEAAELGVPLLSEAIRQGFLHPQCNCSPQTYYPGDPIPEITKEDRDEAVRKYKLTQKQRYNERQIRKWKASEKAAPDDAAKQAARAKVKAWQKENKALCDANPDTLRRDYEREKLYDMPDKPIVPNTIEKPEKMLDKSAGSGIIEAWDNNSLYHEVAEEEISRIPDLEVFEDAELNAAYQKACQDLLTEASKHKELKTGTEFSIVYDADMKPIEGQTYRIGGVGHVPVSNPGIPFHAFHNHPSDETFSFTDLINFADIENMLSFAAVGNIGSLYHISRTEKSDNNGYRFFLCKMSKRIIYSANGDDFTLKLLSSDEQKDAAKTAISKLSATQLEELKIAIVEHGKACAIGGEDYGFRYKFKKT